MTSTTVLWIGYTSILVFGLALTAYARLTLPVRRSHSGHNGRRPAHAR